MTCFLSFFWLIFPIPVEQYGILEELCFISLVLSRISSQYSTVKKKLNQSKVFIILLLVYRYELLKWDCSRSFTNTSTYFTVDMKKHGRK